MYSSHHPATRIDPYLSHHPSTRNDHYSSRHPSTRTNPCTRPTILPLELIHVLVPHPSARTYSLESLDQINLSISLQFLLRKDFISNSKIFSFQATANSKSILFYIKFSFQQMPCHFFLNLYSFRETYFSLS